MPFHRIQLLSSSQVINKSTKMASSPSDHNNNDKGVPIENHHLHCQTQAHSQTPESQSPPKVHSVTVCMVPPPEQTETWKILSEMRLQLKDPGYYRWPPHVNLLYPFLKLNHTTNFTSNDDNSLESVSGIVKQLESATRRIPPFRVVLDRFGTFGGKRRGVLWLHPSSSRIIDDEETSTTTTPNVESEPLQELQQCLEEAFPMCRDQSQKGDNGSFVPHMTLSHFESLQDAEKSQSSLEKFFTSILFQGGDIENCDNDGPLSFVLDRIYLLERKGDSGQFLRVAEIALGGNDHQGNKPLSQTCIFDPPVPFPGMPSTEEDWVYEERMKLKKRRNNSTRGVGGARRRKSYRCRIPRIPDSPEVIAAKRAERKAKRERLLSLEENEKTEKAQASDSSD
jgi:2'-5' RNA ligase